MSSILDKFITLISSVTYTKEEINENYSQKEHNHTTSEVTDWLNKVYPVGSIYMSATNDDPHTLFGGTWVRIQDRFLLASGSTYSATYDSSGFANKTAGASTVSLTNAQMPRHTHIQDAHTHIQDAHTHIQEAHTHIQDAHNHSQNAHWHRLNNSAIVYNANGNHVQNASGGGTKSSLNTNLNVGTDNATASNNATTATNQSTTAINQNTTAINQTYTAVNKYTGGTGTSQSASNGSAHDNMPPYLVVNIWKRTK